MYSLRKIVNPSQNIVDFSKVSASRTNDKQVKYTKKSFGKSFVDYLSTIYQFYTKK